MKIIFLGTGTSTGIPSIGLNYPVCSSKDFRDKRLRSSILINHNKKNIVIDCGPDFRQQLLTNNITRVDSILFTHEHADHTAGLDDVRPISFKNGKIPIYAHDRVLKNLKHRFLYLFEKQNDYAGDVHLIPNRVCENKAFNLHDFTVKPISYSHHKLQVFGYRINDFAYITDLKKIDKTEKNKLLNLDCLVLNALRHHKHYSHINLEEALQIIHDIKPKKTYLTHIAPHMGFHSDTEKLLPKSVFLAYDGLEIKV